MVNLALHDAVIICDAHVPFQDQKFLDKAIRAAEKLNFPLVHVGDLFDFKSISRFMDAGVDWDAPTLEEEFSELKRAFRQNKQPLIATLGNHEERIGKITRGHFTPRALFSLLKPTVTKFVQSRVVRLNRWWTVFHPEYAGINVLGLGQRFTNKIRHNLILAHCHQTATGYSIDGKYRVVCLGGITDAKKHTYITTSISPYPAQVKSFAVVTGKELTLVTGA